MGYIRHCDICGEYNASTNYVVRLTDDKGYRDINGHEECINKIYNRYEELNAEKWSVDKTMIELGIGE